LLDAAADPSLLWALLSRTPGALWMTDSELQCRFASRAAIDRLGLVPGRPIGSGSGSLGDLPNESGAHGDAHRRALAGESVRYDVRRERETFTCLVEALRDPSGRIIGVVGSAEPVNAPQTWRDQQLLETAVLQATDCIGIADAEGRLLFFNPAARKIADRDPKGTGLAEGPAVWGECFERDEDEQPVPVYDWPVARALRGETTVGRELHKRHADGSRTYIQIAATPVRDAGGAIVGAVTTFTDITDRKRAEREIRALNEDLERRVHARTAALEAAQRELEQEVAERREIAESLDRSRRMLQAILNRSTAVIYVKDTAGRFLLINEHFERLFGVRNEDVVGQTDYDLFPPEVAAGLRGNDERVFATGEPLVFDEVVPQDGASHTYVSVKFPLYDDGGSIYAVCGISTDITERQAMEAELRRSEALLSAVIESSTDAIFAIDPDFRLIARNAVVAHLSERLTGTAWRAGAKVCADLPSDHVERWRAQVARALAGERLVVEETIPIDGVTRHYLASLNSIASAGRVSGVTVFVKDITELRRTEARAREHQAELAHALRLHTMGEMAAGLAHEINQPLGAIANFAQGCIRRLRAGAVEGDELLQCAEEIAREALRAGAITRRMRELLRKGDPRREPTDLNRIVSAALDIVAPAARQRAAVLRFHGGPDLPPVDVDGIQIEQVVINLVLNALEAIEGPGRAREIDVRTHPTRDNGVQVAVCDGGIGLDRAAIERIFEPFFTTKPNGLGMGLAISRSIVEAHGGRLWATPNDAVGATFYFVLPAASADAR
jgi:PAS domain S-box-containing protein